MEQSMKTDPHATFRDVIDKTLAGGASPEDDQSLQEHLAACAQCQEYLSAGNRVIGGLGGFSFDVDPGLQQKVFWSLSVRAQQLEAAQSHRRRIVLGCVGALVLMITGSFVALEFGNLVAAALSLPPMQVQRLLLLLWVIPSLCVSLLFPILPMLSHREERFL
jgi:predicted anti-sigma-YlaC factor YlaD